MMKRISLLLCLILVAVLLCGCGTKSLNVARDAYNQGDYETVISLLSEKTTLSEEESALLLNSKIRLAFASGDYQTVVDLIDASNPGDGETYAMLVEARSELNRQAEEEAARLLAEEEARQEELRKAAEAAAAAAEADEERDEAAYEAEGPAQPEANSVEMPAPAAESASDALSSGADNMAPDVSSLQAEETPWPDAYTEEYSQVLDTGELSALLKAGVDERYLELPSAGSWYEAPKTLYIRKAELGPSVQMETVPRVNTGLPTMSPAYEGTKVTAVAEQNGMTCILYPGYDNLQHVGWTLSSNLVESYPSKMIEIGSSGQTGKTLTEHMDQPWSGYGFLTVSHSFTKLDDPVENCLGFTLEYQIIAERTPYWPMILGPRTIYVFDGSNWTSVGTFEYPEFGAVRAEIRLPEAMRVEGIGVIADCAMPNIFLFRQYASDFLLAN